MHWCTDYKELGAMMKKIGMEHAPKPTVEMLTVEIVESPDDNKSLGIPFYSNEGSNDEEKKHPPSFHNVNNINQFFMLIVNINK